MLNDNDGTNINNNNQYIEFLLRQTYYKTLVFNPHKNPDIITIHINR